MGKLDLEQVYSHEKIVQFWARCDHWTLKDAFRLLAELPPGVVDNVPLSEEAEKKLAIWIAVAKNCAGKSLSTLHHAIDGEFRVDPIDFLRWVRDRGLPIPETLQQAVEQAQNRVLGKVDKKLRNNQRRREMCRGIASLLWESTPTLAITRMARRPELLKHGCEGYEYAPETIENWIRDLCPEAKVGRPKKS